MFDILGCCFTILTQESNILLLRLLHSACNWYVDILTLYNGFKAYLKKNLKKTELAQRIQKSDTNI